MILLIVLHSMEYFLRGNGQISSASGRHMNGTQSNLLLAYGPVPQGNKREVSTFLFAMTGSAHANVVFHAT